MTAQKGKDLLLKVDSDGEERVASSRSAACGRGRSHSTQQRSMSQTRNRRDDARAA